MTAQGLVYRASCASYSDAEMRTTRFQENCSFPTFCDEEIELSREDFVIALEFKIGLYLGGGMIIFVVVFLAALCSVQNLNSWTRHETWAPSSGSVES